MRQQRRQVVQSRTGVSTDVAYTILDEGVIRALAEAADLIITEQ